MAIKLSIEIEKDSIEETSQYLEYIVSEIRRGFECGEGWTLINNES